IPYVNFSSRVARDRVSRRAIGHAQWVLAMAARIGDEDVGELLPGALEPRLPVRVHPLARLDAIVAMHALAFIDEEYVIADNDFLAGHEAAEIRQLRTQLDLDVSQPPPPHLFVNPGSELRMLVDKFGEIAFANLYHLD